MFILVSYYDCYDDGMQNIKMYKFNSQEELDEARNLLGKIGLKFLDSFTEYVAPKLYYFVFYSNKKFIISEEYRDANIEDTISKIDFEDVIISYNNISIFSNKTDAYNFCDEMNAKLSEYKSVLIKTNVFYGSVYVRKSLETFTINRKTFDMNGQLISNYIEPIPHTINTSFSSNFNIQASGVPH